MSTNSIKSNNRSNLDNRPLMSADNIYMIYRSKVEHASVVALKGVSLELQKGDFVSIIGPSGSGKSTLLKILGGLMRPTAGSLYFKGQEITKVAEEGLTEYRRQQVGFVFQEGNLLPDLSAYDNINQSMAFNNLPYEYRKKRTLELLDLMGVLHRKNQRATLLSGGERQRVAIARAMANEPSLIIADEPTGNVDFKTSVRLLELFKELNRETGMTFLIATHSNHVASYASRSVELCDGLILGQHGDNVDLSQLDTSRIALMDADNRITLPDGILAQLKTTGYLWDLEIIDGSKVLLTPLDALTRTTAGSKTRECPICGITNPSSNKICSSCGAKF
ncbi:MAG: ATP-binding cassette domain-containing protein [Candidatus Hodarchaeales archaeon]